MSELDNNQRETLGGSPLGRSRRRSIFLPLQSPAARNLENIMDFKNVCRVCANVTDNIVPILTGDGRQLNLSRKLTKHLKIIVLAGDYPRLPVVMCMSCTNTLLAFDEMVGGFTGAEAALRQRSSVLQARREQEQRQERINRNLQENGVWDLESERAASPALPSDDDDRPRATVASEKLIAYTAFYAALLNLRNHYVEKHAVRPRAYPEFTESSEGEGGEKGAQGDAAGDEFDDLSLCNMRRDRMDEETRRELATARVREADRLRYACDACGKRLSSAHTWLWHRRIHSGERPCVCHVCGKQFRAPGGLRRHLAETHARARRRACRLCGRTFANSQNLKQHMRTHTGERPYACALCGRRFAQAGSLHAHRKTHSAALPHRCALCPAAFRLRAGLTRHRLRHSDERPHACGACARAFRTRADLRAHAAAHGPARAHACALCAAAFRSRRALRHHARRLHADAPGDQAPADREYFVLAPLRRCPLCSAALATARYSEHLRTRHVDRLFECSNCDSLVERNELVPHMKEHAEQLATAWNVAWSAASGPLTGRRRTTREEISLFVPEIVEIEFPDSDAEDVLGSELSTSEAPRTINQTPQEPEIVEVEENPPQESLVSENPPANPQESLVSENLPANPPHESLVSENLHANPPQDTLITVNPPANPLQESLISENPPANLPQESLISENPPANPPQKSLISENPPANPPQESLISENPPANPLQESLISENPPANPPQESLISENPPANPLQETLSENPPANPLQESLISEDPPANPLQESLSENPPANPLQESLMSENPPASPFQKSLISENPPADPPMVLSDEPKKDGEVIKLEKKPTRSCPHCPRTFRASSTYFYHIKHFHNQSKDHVCGKCGKRFGTRGMLREHASVHTGAREHQCGQCPKKFCTKASLYIHQQTHGAVKKFSCNQCPMAFRWSTQLDRHLARHAAERKHACSTCGKAFSVRADLLRHGRTHARAEHACPEAPCAARFAQPRYLRSHVTRKHANASRDAENWA